MSETPQQLQIRGLIESNVELRSKLDRTKAELAEVTADRNRLQSILDCPSKICPEGCIGHDWRPAPEPKPEAPKCPACDDGLIWHEKEPGFQQWSTKCGVCGGTGRAQQ